MSKIVGYGEDSFTLWALKRHTSNVLREFQDETPSSDCLIFYRPSFGRHSRESSSVFGEFDAIIASSENIYLIESKWDNLAESDKDEIILNKEQKLRHQIFSWYLMHWNNKYQNNWESFIKERQNDFRFKGKTIAPTGSLLAMNLEFILDKSLRRCKGVSSEHIKNVLLFFYNVEKTVPPTKISRDFRLMSIDYSKDILGNFVTLDS